MALYPAWLDFGINLTERIPECPEKTRPHIQIQNQKKLFSRPEGSAKQGPEAGRQPTKLTDGLFQAGGTGRFPHRGTGGGHQ